MVPPVSFLVTTVFAASVASAAVTAFSVLVIVMIASDVGVVAEVTGDQGFNRRVARTTDTAVKLDTRFGKSHLCATANSSADQSICSEILKKGCQSSVTKAIS